MGPCSAPKDTHGPRLLPPTAHPFVKAQSPPWIFSIYHPTGKEIEGWGLQVDV